MAGPGREEDSGSFWTGSATPLHIGAEALLLQVKIFTKEEIAQVAHLYPPPVKKNQCPVELYHQQRQFFWGSLL